MPSFCVNGASFPGDYDKKECDHDRSLNVGINNGNSLRYDRSIKIHPGQAQIPKKKRK